MAQLRAVFEMTNGAPAFTQGDRYKHYAIILSVAEVPEDALTIIYELDDSYANPIRMVTKGVPNYQEYITSYGNFSIRILYRPMRDPNILQPLLSQKLSDALIASYEPPVSEAVALAIKDILDHNV